MQGYVKQIESQLRLAKGLEYILDLIQSKRLGISIEELHKRQNAEWWLIGSEAIIEAKAADDVVKVSCDSQLGKPVIEKDKEGKETVIYKCPL